MVLALDQSAPRFKQRGEESSEAVKVSLEDFIRYGFLGPIELGSSRDFVEQQLGSPDFWDARCKDYLKAKIWKYSNIELYFQNDLVSMIFMDDFSFSDSVIVRIENGFIKPRLCLSEAKRCLEISHILFREKHLMNQEDITSLVTISGVILTFERKNVGAPELKSIFRCDEGNF